MPGEMKSFLDASREIAARIKRLRSYSAELERYLLTKQNNVLNEEEEQQLDRRIEAANDIFTTTATETQEMIRKNQHWTKRLRKQKALAKSLLELRELHMYKHGNDLAEAMRGYQNIQFEQKDRENDRLVEVYLVTNPNATQEEIDDLRQGGDLKAKVESSFALGSRSAKKILDTANSRRVKIEKIAERIRTVSGLIGDVDSLVKKNTKVTDDIVLHMASAEEHTKESTRQLTSALYYEVRAMRVKRIIAIIIGVLLVLGVLYIAKVLNIFGTRDNSRSNNNDQDNNGDNNNGG